jgi:hypothetical protein
MMQQSAMASDRPYRRALDMISIQREIQTGWNTIRPQVARVMLEILEEEEVLLVNSAGHFSSWRKNSRT